MYKQELRGNSSWYVIFLNTSFVHCCSVNDLLLILCSALNKIIDSLVEDHGDSSALVMDLLEVLQ